MVDQARAVRSVLPSRHVWRCDTDPAASFGAYPFGEPDVTRPRDEWASVCRDCRRLVTGCLDAESGENPSDRPCEDNGDRQPYGSAKQRWANLRGDDDVRSQRERGGNHHRPLAWLVGIGDYGLIHGVEATGARR